MKSSTCQLGKGAIQVLRNATGGGRVSNFQGENVTKMCGSKLLVIRGGGWVSTLEWPLTKCNNNTNILHSLSCADFFESSEKFFPADASECQLVIPRCVSIFLTDVSRCSGPSLLVAWCILGRHTRADVINKVNCPDCPLVFQM